MFHRPVPSLSALRAVLLSDETAASAQTRAFAEEFAKNPLFAFSQRGLKALEAAAVLQAASEVLAGLPAEEPAGHAAQRDLLQAVSSYIASRADGATQTILRLDGSSSPMANLVDRANAVAWTSLRDRTRVS